MDPHYRLYLADRDALARLLGSRDEAAYARLAARKTRDDPAAGHLAYAILDLPAGGAPPGPPPDGDLAAFRDACLFYQGLAALVEREGQPFPYVVPIEEMDKLERLAQEAGPAAAAHAARLRTGRWWGSGEPGVLDALQEFGVKVGWLSAAECRALRDALRAARALADEPATVRRFGGDRRTVLALVDGACRLLEAPIDSGKDLFAVLS